MGTLLKLIKNNKELATIVGFILLMIVIVIFQLSKPPKPVSRQDASFKKTESQAQVPWGQVVPGQTTYEEAKNSFGGFKQRVTEENLVVYQHVATEEESFYRETNVATDEKGIIKFIDLKINPFKKFNLSVYGAKFGLDEPDIKKDIEDVAAHEAYVYLKEGIMLYVRKDTKSIRNEIYFEPMTKSQFMALWGDKLTDEFDLDIHNEGI